MPMGRLYLGTRRPRKLPSLPLSSSKPSGQVVATKAYVKRLIKSTTELKYDLNKQTAAAGDAFDYAGQLYNLFYPAQGDTDQTRDGDKAKLVSCYMKLSIEKGSAGADFQFCRVIVFQWHQNTADASTPDINDILSGSSNINNFLEPINHDKMMANNFTILYDKIHEICPTRYPVINKKISLKYAKKGVQFNGGASTGTDQLFMWVVSDVDTGAGATTKPLLKFACKVTFTDS